MKEKLELVMPNMCQNRITVIGEKTEDVDAWALNMGFERKAFTFETFSPLEPSWSTMWQNPSTNLWMIEVEFETGWSPPIQAVKAISETYSELTFILLYEESGGNFAGYKEYKAGQIVREDGSEYGGHIRMYPNEEDNDYYDMECDDSEWEAWKANK